MSADDATDWQGGHRAPLGYHRILLEDHARLDAYDRAIRALVQPGDVVLDVGTGTGILAMLAARAGASRVHAIESTEVAGLARRLVEANGLSDVVTVHRADARNLDPVEPVDLVVTECMGRFLVDDGMIPAVEKAREWLKPSGRCCPREIALHVAPVGNLYLGAVDAFGDRILDLDFSPAWSLAHESTYAADLHPSWLFATPKDVHRWTLPWPAPPFDTKTKFVITQSGTLRGFAGWFTASLAEGVRLSTAPGSATHWGQHLFPIPATETIRGDEVEVRLVFNEGDARWEWAGEVRRGDTVLRSFTHMSSQMLDGEPPTVERSPAPSVVDAEAANIAGSGHFASGEYEEAIRAFERAVTLAGDLPPERVQELYENVGIARLHAGHIRAAARAFSRALDGDETSREQSLRLLIRASAALGQSAEAERLSDRYRSAFGALPWESGSDESEQTEE